ncbi:MAG TPA: hypothetical protein VHS53_04440, partial [Mucilaginibacter sp.]|nr:hypothetical protein [Mucilaginibacter sp.]
MSWVIYRGRALRFFGSLVRTTDIFNFYDFFEKCRAEGPVRAAGVQPADSNAGQVVLLTTSDPPADGNTKFPLPYGRGDEPESIDSSTTLKYVCEEIGKIRELLDSVEFVREPQ